MSCDYEGRNELRSALLQSTMILQTALGLARGPKEKGVLAQQIARNKLVLRTEVSIRLPQSSLDEEI